MLVVEVMVVDGGQKINNHEINCDGHGSVVLWGVKWVI